MKANRRVNKLPSSRVLNSLLWVLVQSRVAVFFVQCASNWLLPDHNADATKPEEITNKTLGDEIIVGLFEGFSRWDSVHFLQIARHGYKVERNLAFAPLFPLLTRTITDFLRTILSSFLPAAVSYTSALLLAAVCINFLSFIGAGVALFKLSLLMLPNPNIAVLAVVLYAINPSAIFFSAAYSESLYALFTFAGLYLLYRGSDANVLKCALEASVCFALALLTRSNGIANLGYVLFAILSFGLSTLNGAERKLTGRVVKYLVCCLFIGALCCCVIVAPFAIHHYYIYDAFCSYLPRANPIQRTSVPVDSGTSTTSVAHWCNNWIPFSYGYVQAKYWDVGFLRYYQLRKIPLFLLALPVFTLTFCAVRRFIKATLHPENDTSRNENLLGRRSFLPFILHLLALCLLGLLFANVEITTRMIFSSNPILLWFCAGLFSAETGVEMTVAVLENKSILSLVRTLWHCSCTENCFNRAGLVLLYFLTYAIVDCSFKFSMEEGKSQRPQFGTRYLNEKADVFKHNAWDNVEWDDEQEQQARAKVVTDLSQRLSAESQETYERDASSYWDKFYGIHDNKFFKDRNWLFTEFPELLPQPVSSMDSLQQSTADANARSNDHDDGYPGSAAVFRILEVGCGCGNTIFPILETNNDPNLFVYGCDFSSAAIDLVKSNELYQLNRGRCHAFVCDISSDELADFPLPKGSLDIVVMVFVLSAILPSKMPLVLNRLAEYLKPGGLLLFRDYGLYDMTQLRFKPSRCLAENFYVRGDGTRVYFFTQEEIDKLFCTAGLSKELNMIDRRLQVNRGKQLKMYRIWIQCRYRKPIKPDESASCCNLAHSDV